MSCVSGCLLQARRNASRPCRSASSRNDSSGRSSDGHAAHQGRRAVEHQAAHERRMACGEFEHHARALRHAHQQRADDAEHREQRAEVGEVVRQRRVAARESEAAPVVTHHAQLGGQRQLRLPDVEVQGPAMHEHDGRGRSPRRLYRRRAPGTCSSTVHFSLRFRISNRFRKQAHGRGMTGVKLADPLGLRAERDARHARQTRRRSRGWTLRSIARRWRTRRSSWKRGASGWNCQRGNHAPGLVVHRHGHGDHAVGQLRPRPAE
jgi:hypothetical protein